MTKLEKYNRIADMGVGRSGLPDENALLWKALEKQIPSAPILEYDGYADGYPVVENWQCPNCGAYYDIDDKLTHCSNCGQAINWEDETHES